MKKYLVLIIFLIFLLSFNSVFAISTEDENKISEKMNLIVNSINNNSDVESIYDNISPNASINLKEDIRKNIEGKKFKYGIQLEDVEEIEPEKIKLNCRFIAIKNIGYIIHFTSKIEGLKTYFIFEKIDGEWYLLESDFAKKLDSKVFNLVFVIVLLIFAFWIWMIVDVAKKPIKSKTLWVLVIILFNFIGAIIYFIFPRRKYIKSFKKDEKLNTDENNS